ncbi:hypothetical protein V1264_005270 [Littorina saxatilis]|uniref:Antistasin-like domain-containing protein n=1 Tax=Littorina saxatilis TaxID=31220 RepID=A0AAN9AZJ8_9CAEN
MKIAVIFLFAALVVSSHAFSLRQLVGTCVEMCSSDDDCGQGYHCRSNGCGHTCQKPFLSIGGLHDCRFNAICNNYCFHGHAHDANGCPTCACNPDPTTT